MHEVFPLCFRGSTESRWQKKKVGDRLVMEASYDQSGLCFGATVAWLKKSIASRGKGVLSAEELSIHEVAIIQGMYIRYPIPDIMSQIDNLFNVLSYVNLDVQDCMRGVGCFNLQNIFKWLSREPCHCMFAFCKRFEGGHSMGLRNTGSLMEIFDATTGLTQHTDSETFITDLYITAVLKHLYIVGGEWAVYKVNSAVD